MSRFDELLKIIQKIKHRRCLMGRGTPSALMPVAGTNIELSRYCRTSKDLTSRWFWVEKPTVRAKATVTVRALNWICEKGTTPLLFPEWEIIRFRLQQQIYHGRTTSGKMADYYGVKTKALLQYLKPPWEKGSREPKGEFALRVLGYFLSSQITREHFMNFLAGHLGEYPCDSAPAEYGAELTLEYERLQKHFHSQSMRYDSEEFELPVWLQSILKGPPSSKTRGKG